MFGTSTSYANEVLEVAPTYNYVKKGSQISIIDVYGEVIYSGEIKHNGNLTTLFDFSQLENGEYTVEVTRDFEIEINTIKVKDRSVSYITANKKTVFKPVVRNRNGQVLISKLALTSDTMEIELYFEGDLINSETIKGGNVLNRVYKLDETIKGDYTAIIKSNDRVFIENFKI
jgi:hypothetical protein